MDYISQDRLDMLSGGKIRDGDVLFCLRGSVGKTALVANVNTGAIASSLVIVRSSSATSSRFVYHYLSSPAVAEQIRTFDNGTAQPNLASRSLEGFLMPLPPLAEQERIVAVVEEQLSRLDAGVAALEHVQLNIKRLRASVLETAVTGRVLVTEGNSTRSDNGLPSGWSWRPLKDIITLLRNGVFVSRPGVEPVGHPILRISAVRPMALDIDDVRYVQTGAMPDRAEQFVLSGGDLLFTRYSGNPEYVGACAIMPMDGPRLLYPDKLIRVQADRAVVEPRFIEIAASAGVTRRAIRSRVKTTAGQTGISGSDLKSVIFPVPPLDVQRRIVEFVDHAMADIRRLEDTVVTEVQRSSSLRASILAVAFCGRLVPRDPTDQPASVLLERIATEGAASNGHKPTSRRRGTKGTT